MIKVNSESNVANNTIFPPCSKNASSRVRTPPILSDKIPAATRPPELKIAKIEARYTAFGRFACTLAMFVMLPMIIKPTEAARAYISHNA
ncbi:Uncharacterised protein [Vibrio cholerae]|uniref:Uncharacterized protein n=1 Tax=Vibrio cholerae TaxID=666 RepID=A0A655YHT9_VIBCL|nr:Uncharacterised protein [Vibrio cholerae]CSC22219.1 Uncharacterised protein [Vibrio cholerae]CSC38789.1 Uncharacterised protein [Vibrio cholerae]CSC53758.1 Uncharacterised protein [Vibrio cholerae]CSC57793.1 Uncharacterised protein [Vibrio cholerae]